MPANEQAEGVAAVRGITVALALGILAVGAVLCLSWAADALAGDTLPDGRTLVGPILVGLGVWLAVRIDQAVRGGAR